MVNRRARFGKPGMPVKQGSISFLKKRNKKLLLLWLTRLIRSARIAASRSFLVLFFKKELLPITFPSLREGVSQMARRGNPVATNAV
jgi:hypothetical protein